jgi:DNA-binding transcriptional ArsR family regulator
MDSRKTHIEPGIAEATRSLGPDALKAFAHPLRMAMYSRLSALGSATASQLARLLDESSGQTSYHLRQLERHGFVEDDPAHQGGRERWWRPVGFQLTDASLLMSPDTEGAAGLVIQHAIAERTAALASWLENLDPTTEEPGLMSAATLNLSLAQAEQLTTELGELVKKFQESRADDGSDGTRRYRVHLDVFPINQPESAT